VCNYEDISFVLNLSEQASLFLNKPT
jgi:hypothetical protein